MELTRSVDTFPLEKEVPSTPKELPTHAPEFLRQMVIRSDLGERRRRCRASSN